MKTETTKHVKEIQGYIEKKQTLESFVKQCCSECVFSMCVMVSGKECLRCGYGGFKVERFGSCKFFKNEN